MKKYSYPILIILLVLFNIGICFKYQDRYLLEDYAAFTMNQEKKIEIRDDSKYKIRIYYPSSKYSLLNTTIEDKIEEYIIEFKKNIDNASNDINYFYTLDITYDTYHYKDYISYLFNIVSDVGGAHPSYYIWTIRYDINENKVITINDILKEYPNFLNLLSNYVQKQLVLNERIPDISWMLEGTKPTVDNYQNLVFSKDGIFVFFPPYQIAPYSSGSFQIFIPYKQIYKE